MRAAPHSLVGRLALAFLLPSCVILVLGALAAYLRTTAALRQSVFERLDAIATVKESALDTWVDHLSGEVVLFSELPELREPASELVTGAPPEARRQAARARLADLLRLALDKRPSYREMFFLAPTGGRIVVSTDERNEGQYRVYDRYFVEGRSAPFVQNVYPSPVTLRPTLTLAAPVRAESGELLGVLAAHLALDYLDRNILRRAGLGRGGAVTLVDRYRVVVTGRRYGNAVPGAAASPAIEAVSRGASGAGLYRDPGGSEVIGLYRWLEDRELGLIVEIPREEAFAPARRLALSIFLAGSFLVALLAAGIYLAARRIARPIQALTGAAAGVRDGDLSSRAPAAADDEIGDLARTFNRMVEQLAAEAEDRRVATELRESLIAELEAKNDELERFTYTVSHDLKAPLVTIRGFLGFLKEDAAAVASDPAAAGRVDRDVGRIDDAAAKMAGLLEDLLALSRIGRQTGQLEDVALGEIAREARELVAGAIAQGGVEVEIASDLPAVCGDRVRLVELVQNLIENAVRYMGDQPSPRIEIEMRVTAATPVFFVRDNGIGIDPRYHEKVFGLFERLDPQATEGTGVGLALVQRIVELHGGRIWVESEGEGQGSTFCFTLPAADR